MRPVHSLSVFSLLFLCGVLLSGCLGPGQATAMEAQALGDHLAIEWDPDSVLVFAVGLEGRVDQEGLREVLREHWFEDFGFGSFSSSNESDGDWWQRLERDPVPGNGKAELWALHYLSGDGERELVLLLGRDGEVVVENERSVFEHDSPVGEYVWDSDRAMRVAKQASPELRAVMEAPNMLVGSGLLFDEAHGGPVWTFGGIGGGFTGFAGAVVQVDASTGEVLLVEGDAWGY